MQIEAISADAADIVVVTLNSFHSLDPVRAAGGKRDQDHDRHDANDDPAPGQPATTVVGAHGLLRRLRVRVINAGLAGVLARRRIGRRSLGRT